MISSEYQNSAIDIPVRVIAWFQRLLLACAVASPLGMFGSVVFARPPPPFNQSPIISGHVFAPGYPLAGADVRIQALPISTKTDSAGHFSLISPSYVNEIIITATAPGYYIGGGIACRPGDRDVVIRLDKHCEIDNMGYEWVSASSAVSREAACQNCHADSSGLDPELPFDQWRRDAHSGSVGNVRFLTMYLGTDVHGNRSPLTRRHGSRDYNPVPIRPDPARPYYGPGYKLDFPGTNGNCAACHAPMAAIDNPYGIDPSRLAGVTTEGVGCDFCHKIMDVSLDPYTGLPPDNRPGVLSFVFRRPSPGHQLFTGPFADVAPGEDVHAPVQRESRICAPCHSARFWNVEIYNSYGEWLASPYARAGSVTTCQDCHMPPGLADHFVRTAAGGRTRDPLTIFGHRMPGARDANLLRNAVTMKAEAEVREGILSVKVRIINDRTGHHVPTGSPLRHMLLIVRAFGTDGRALGLRDGPTLPDWCGIGDPDDGRFAGLPGTCYAKILRELWTGVSPTGAYWNQTRLVSDNRIAAMASDETMYDFEPPDGEATVDVRLLYRRAIIELQDQKGWEEKDIEMARQMLIVTPADGSAAAVAESAGK